MKRITATYPFLLLMLLACLADLSAMAQPAYVVTDLGTLGGKSVEAVAINDAGQIVGTSATSEYHADGDPITHAFIWQDGKMSDLGARPDFPDSEARDINNQGQVLVNIRSHPPKSQKPWISLSMPGPPFIWHDGKKTDLSVPRRQSGRSVSHINDDGTIVDEGFTGLNNNGHKIVNRHLPTEKLPNGAYTSYTLAVISYADKDVELGTLGGRSSSAHGLNDVGQVVGYSTTAARESRAFLWADGKMVKLGTLPNYGDSSASAINNRGQIVGWLYPHKEKSHAALWQDGQVYDLNTLIPPDSGWLLENASALNEKGQIIGTGTKDGAQRAFLLTPRKD